MKKIHVFTVILLMILSFTACSGTADVPEITTTAPTTVPTTLSGSTVVSQGDVTDVSELQSEETTMQNTTFIPTTESTTELTNEYTTEQPTTQIPTSVPTTQEAATQATTVAIATEPTTAEAIPPSTVPATTQPTTVAQTTQMQNYCSVRIECSTIYNNLGKLKDGKKSFLPSSGVILDDVKVALTGGESAFDVIKKACEENVCTDACQYCRAGGVQFEYTYTPAFNNYYIEGIHQIYEKDCGTQSGWMYSVNGEFPDVGSSSYMVSQGDTIVFSFTCNMGEDIGNSY